MQVVAPEFAAELVAPLNVVRAGWLRILVGSSVMSQFYPYWRGTAPIRGRGGILCKWPMCDRFALSAVPPNPL